MTERTVKMSGAAAGLDEKDSLGRSFIMGGALIGLLIGSGFATGQEIMQYFVSYGYWGIVGAAVVLILLSFVGVGFISVGNVLKFERGTKVYDYFCGERLGRFYDFFSNAFVFMTYIIMIAGAASTGAQQFGLPLWAGAVGMTLLVIGSVLLGLNNFVNIIGTIMPIVIIACFYLAFHTLFTSAALIPQNTLVINELVGKGALMQASGNWFTAAFSYVGFSILLMAVFMAETGKSAGSLREARRGALIGAVALCLAILILTAALMSKAHLIGESAIPSLVIANQINPLFGNFYSLMMFVGIYSTAVPLLWNPCARFAKEGTVRFKSLVIALGLSGGVIALFVEFPKLINVIYVLNGYVGVLLLGIMVVHFLRYKGFIKTEHK